jgi:hypothetical protein
MKEMSKKFNNLEEKLKKNMRISIVDYKLRRNEILNDNT